MHINFAGIVSKLFKFQELKLNGKRRIFHFKCPGDFLVQNKLMDYPVGLKYHVSLSICCFKLPAAMLFIFKFQHFSSHPLFNNAGLCIGFKKQFQWQIKFPCDYGVAD